MITNQQLALSLSVMTRKGTPVEVTERAAAYLTWLEDGAEIPEPAKTPAPTDRAWLRTQPGYQKEPTWSQLHLF